MTQKLKDYQLFKKAYNIILNKEHLTPEGIEKLLNLKNSINRGLSPELLKTFSNIKFENTPILTKKELPFNLDPNWISGFISGDGSFQVDIRKNDTFKLKYQVLLRFSLSQHARDEQLLRNLI